MMLSSKTVDPEERTPYNRLSRRETSHLRHEGTKKINPTVAAKECCAIASLDRASEALQGEVGTETTL